VVVVAAVEVMACDAPTGAISSPYINGVVVTISGDGNAADSNGCGEDVDLIASLMLLSPTPCPNGKWISSGTFWAPVSSGQHGMLAKGWLFSPSSG